MTLVPVMWSVWGALAVITAALHIYRSSIENDEEDQIFLDDSFDHERVAQQAIIAKVNKVQPVLRVFMGLAVVSTVFVIGYYIWDIAHHF